VDEGVLEVALEKSILSQELEGSLPDPLLPDPLLP
jgi:hypothetical protein